MRQLAREQGYDGLEFDYWREAAAFVETFTPILTRIEGAGIEAALYALHGPTFLGNLAAYERV